MKNKDPLAPYSKSSSNSPSAETTPSGDHFLGATATGAGKSRDGDPAVATVPPAPAASTDTIVALSTAPGRSAIAVTRLSGPQALAIAAGFLLTRSPLAHARAHLARVLETASSSQPDSTLDQAVVTAFFAPLSFTGEDQVEIATHGSPVVVEAVIQAALAGGARLAEPGEFTQRAFLSGRLDLTQAEAIHDLIAAKTLAQVRLAAQQLGGSLSRRIAPAKEQLLYLIALLEAGMDFASGELDDVDVVPPAQIASAIIAVQAALQPLAASFRSGQLLRNGASLALVGRPNAGKSSLFNRLLERDRAIVTAVPGTTRDTVEETFALGGIPLRLVDTAGLRLAGDTPLDDAELQGIARSREALADADLVLLVYDATASLTEDEKALEASLAGRPHLIVRNKIDLLGNRAASEGLQTSALTGEGIPELRAAILALLQTDSALNENGALTTLRQLEAVQAALAALEQAAAANDAGVPHEVLLMDLHTTLRALDSLTGVTTTDDILGRIFSTFCIGK